MLWAWDTHLKSQISFGCADPRAHRVESQQQWPEIDDIDKPIVEPTFKQIDIYLAATSCWKSVFSNPECSVK